ncbi:MAG: DUF3667 domain-containing protein [Saprospiraceae bacterium]|nr:DUF3667 domain-containing protein [Saprospiraceae bacterium]
MIDIRKTVMERLLHHDQGILLLTRDLAIRPGITIHNYFSGKRKRYYDPFKYLMLSVGLSVLATHTFGLMQGGANSHNPVSAFAEKHFNLILFVSVPFAAAWSWLLFRRKGYNFAEHLSMQAFIGGFRTVFFLLLFAPLVVLFREHYNTILMLFVVVRLFYLLWVYLQFFGQPRWINGLKTLLLFLLLELTMMVLIIGFFLLINPGGLRAQ